MKKNIFVIGGTGYIGSHMVRLLQEQGFNPIVFDNFSQKNVQKTKGVKLIKGDIREYSAIKKALIESSADTVMYFAGLIIAPESCTDPVKYYDNNVLGAVNVLKAMHELRVNKIIFSSTAAVYGMPKRVPIKEDDLLCPINPYGQTKLMFEQMLKDVAAANKNFSYIILRYFNAAGAHVSGELGESHDPETHLIPNVLKAIKGELKEIVIYGNDYPTKDGTCIRDYIHVEDLAEAHYLALKALKNGIKNEIFNLGSGKGYSVKEIIDAAEAVTGRKVRIRLTARRPGDSAKLIASSSKAKKILSWQPKRNLNTIIQSAWGWEKGR